MQSSQNTHIAVRSRSRRTSLSPPTQFSSVGIRGNRLAKRPEPVTPTRTKPSRPTTVRRPVEVAADIVEVSDRFSKRITNNVPFAIVLARTSEPLSYTDVPETRLPRYQDLAHLVILSPSHLFRIFQKKYMFSVCGVEIPEGFAVTRRDWQGFQVRIRLLKEMFAMVKETRDIDDDMKGRMKEMHRLWDIEVEEREKTMERRNPVPSGSDHGEDNADHPKRTPVYNDTSSDAGSITSHRSSAARLPSGDQPSKKNSALSHTYDSSVVDE